MNNLALKPSELNLISRLRYYKWIGLLRNGKLLLENKTNKRRFTGKIVSSTSESELSIRLQLQHQNINRLLEVLCINDRIKILISPFIGNSIGTLIHDDSFNKNQRCFDRKKSYAKGILSALSYMHQNSVFHLNLNDENVAVCSKTDKAKLCDFSYTVAQKKVTKQLLPPNRPYPSPEVENGSDSETFDSSPLDIWDCGILLLQIFTQHQLPWRGAVIDSLMFLEDVEILKKTNSGANINGEIASEFRVFIQHLLSHNPDHRLSAKQALHSSFLQTLHSRADMKTRRFQKSDIIPDSYAENHHFFHSSTGSDVDVNKLTDASCSKSVKPGLVSTKSEPDNTLHREILDPFLPGFNSFNNNLSAPDVVSMTDSRYPKSDKARLICMKSHPDSTRNLGVPHPSLSPGNVSRFSDNLSTSDIDVVNLSDQDGNVSLTDRDDYVSVNDARHRPKLEKTGWTKSVLNRLLHPYPLFPEYADFPLIPENNDAGSISSEKKIHQCNYLTEWEVGDRLSMKEESNNLFKYYERPHNQKDELPQYPSSSLEHITPYRISREDVNLSDPLSKWCYSLTEALGEMQPQSEPTISKTEMEEWIDIPLENSPEATSLQSQTTSSDKKMRKKKVSITDSLNLISKNSMPKDLRKFDSPILIDKSDLYEKSETRIAEGRQKIAMQKGLATNQLRSDALTVRQKKKWYNKLLWCRHK